MAVHIAEYLGQRTDIDQPVILPIEITQDKSCPFMSRDCTKSGIPMCSVRDTNNIVWIVCPERLCSTKRNIPLSDYQKKQLHSIAKTLFFSDITENKVLVSREVSIPVVTGGSYHADYVMISKDSRSLDSYGPDKVILEMQGGGETSNTGQLTSNAKAWRQTHQNENEQGNNNQLRQDTRANPITTNAWRRQQEQFIVKGNAAMLASKGTGMAFCVGTLLFDYLVKKVEHANLTNLREFNWTLALIEFCEDQDTSIQPGPIPFKIGRTIFTNYQNFVRALVDQGEPSPKIFEGEFETLNGHKINLRPPQAQIQLPHDQ